MQGETTRYDGRELSWVATIQAAEDVQDHVEVVIAPFDAPSDVPGGQKFRLGVLGMAALATAFSNFQTFGQNAMVRIGTSIALRPAAPPIRRQELYR